MVLKLHAQTRKQKFFEIYLKTKWQIINKLQF